VVIVGAGRAATTVGRALAADGNDLCWMNRTPSRAVVLAGSLGGEARPLAELGSELATADAVVFAVSGPAALVDAVTLARAAAGRTRPLLLVDTGMPPALADLDSSPAARIVRLEELSDRSEAYGRRVAAVPAVEAAVAEELRGWRDERRARALAPTIASLYADLDVWLTGTTADLVAATPGADPATVARVLRQAARRFAHSHVTALRRGGAAPHPRLSS
jgi:glutamyl-tRNA reductase